MTIQNKMLTFGLQRYSLGWGSDSLTTKPLDYNVLHYIEDKLEISFTMPNYKNPHKTIMLHHWQQVLRGECSHFVDPPSPLHFLPFYWGGVEPPGQATPIAKGVSLRDTTPFFSHGHYTPTLHVLTVCLRYATLYCYVTYQLM